MYSLAKWLVIAFFAGTVYTGGVSIGSFTATPAVVALIGAVALIVFMRLEDDKPLVSRPVLRVSLVVATLAYFAAGIISGIFADDRTLWAREVIQRMIIILMPMYAVVYGFRTPRDLMSMFVVFIPFGTLIATLCSLQGARSLFRAPVYLFGMHKNHVGGVCSISALICISFLLSNQFPRRKKLILVALAICMLGIIAAQNRASLVGLVLGTCLMSIAIRANRIYIVAIGAAFIAGLGLLSIALPKEAIESAITTRRFSSNWERQMVWSFLAEKLMHDPFVCVGWGNSILIYGTWHVPDAASIFFYDWMQMGLDGVVAQIIMVGLAIWLPLYNARFLPRVSGLMAINNAAMAIVASRFLGAYLDSFWVGRGVSLATFAALGAIVYVRLCLNQITARNVQQQAAVSCGEAKKELPSSGGMLA